MTKVTIKPVKQRIEILSVLSIALGIILLAGFLISNRKDKPEVQLTLEKHQIDAAVSLNEKEFKIFSDIYGVGREEIRKLMADDKGFIVFPSIQQLKSKIIDPFVGGYFYKKYGDHQWSFSRVDTKKQIKAMYIGKSQKPDIAGNFILFIEGEYQLGGVLLMDGIPTVEEQNNNKPASKKLGTIWYKSGQITTPQNYTKGALEKAGWREVVILTGKDKRKGEAK